LPWIASDGQLRTDNEINENELKPASWPDARDSGKDCGRPRTEHNHPKQEREA
jgi:hypothetical protein